MNAPLITDSARPVHAFGPGNRQGHVQTARFLASSGPLSCQFRNHRRHSAHPDDVARQQVQFELQVNAVDSPKHGLAYPADCLGPAEVLFDPLTNPLAGFVPRVARCARVNRTTAGTCPVPRDMRRDMGESAGFHESGGVIRLVRRQGLALRSGNRTDPRQGGLPHG